VLEYGLPEPALARRLLENRLSRFQVDAVSWDEVVEAAQGLSYGELGRAADEAAKDAVLAKSTEVTTKNVIASLIQRRGSARNGTAPANA
jgi:hypothetical protein